MSERPGFRQIWISEAAFRRLGLHDASQAPSGGLAERQIGKRLRFGDRVQSNRR
jgi:hypothetical protein